MKALDEAGVTRLVINCSHPHMDHMGGIVELLSNRAHFYIGASPRFHFIDVIDNGLTNKLVDLLHVTLGYPSDISIRYSIAANKNAFANT